MEAIRVFGECYPPSMWYEGKEGSNRSYHGEFSWILSELSTSSDEIQFTVVSPQPGDLKNLHPLVGAVGQNLTDLVADRFALSYERFQVWPLPNFRIIENICAFNNQKIKVCVRCSGWRPILGPLG